MRRACILNENATEIAADADTERKTKAILKRTRITASALFVMTKTAEDTDTGKRTKK